MSDSDQTGALDRRQLLLCGGALVAGLALRAGRARGAQGALFVSCRVDAEAAHHVTGIDASGRVRFDLPLPERGHGVAFRPGADEGLVFARRPGTFAVAFDPVAGIALRRIDAAAGRHFYGHGAFSPDGRYLFTSENDYEAGRGVLGVRDATDGYRQIGELRLVRRRPARGRPHAGWRHARHRQWRHPHPSRARPGQAQPRQHGALARLSGPVGRQASAAITDLPRRTIS